MRSMMGSFIVTCDGRVGKGEHVPTACVEKQGASF